MDIKPTGQINDHRQRWIPATAFKVAEIGHVHAGAERQFLLREALCRADFAECPPELFPDVHETMTGALPSRLPSDISDVGQLR